jgi:prepilin-type N-terminal cleavage/methylation domain-containing protein
MNQNKESQLTTVRASAWQRVKAFTLIEMLVVLSIVLVLTTLAAGPTVNALRKSSVRKVAASFSDACTTAQLLARRDTSGTTFYGVRMKDSASESYITVITKSTSSSTPVELVGSDGQPVKRLSIPNSAIVWEGDAPLRSGSETLEWWYGPGVGNCVKDPENPHIIYGVGINQPASVGEGNAAYGLDANEIPANAEVYLAQGTDGTPGLHISDINSTFRIAVGVYPSGVAFNLSLNEETEDN